MDVWLHDALRVGIEDGTERGLRNLEVHEQAEALARERAAKAVARAIQNRISAQKRRNGHKFYAAKRPWQAAGYVRKASWLAAGSPGPMARPEED